MLTKTEDAGTEQSMHPVAPGKARADSPNEFFELSQLLFGKGRVFIGRGKMRRDAVQSQIRKACNFLQARDRFLVPAAHPTHPGIDDKIDRAWPGCESLRL